jgi:hypothetical protein
LYTEQRSERRGRRYGGLPKPSHDARKHGALPWSGESQLHSRRVPTGRPQSHLAPHPRQPCKYSNHNSLLSSSLDKLFVFWTGCSLHILFKSSNNLKLKKRIHCSWSRTINKSFKIVNAILCLNLFYGQHISSNNGIYYIQIDGTDDL